MTVKIRTEPQQQYLDNNGNLMVGGKIYTYEPGTGIDKATYKDKDKLVAHSNPIILDAYGRAEIWWDDTYKVTVNDALDNLVYTLDDYGAREEETSFSVVATKAAAKALTLVSGSKVFVTSDDGGEFTMKTGAAAGTYNDNGGVYCGTQFTSGDGSSGLLRDYFGAFNVRWFGAKLDGSDDASFIQAALDSSGSIPVLIPYTASNVIIETTLTIDSYQTLKIDDHTTLKLKDATNDEIIENADLVSGNTNITIIGGNFDGNKANQTIAASVIRFDNVSKSRLEYVNVLNGNQALSTVGAIDFDTCDNVEAFECSVTGAATEGLYIRDGNSNKVIGGEYYSNGYSGVAMETSPNCEFIRIHAHNNGASNLSINGQYSRVIGNKCQSAGNSLHGITIGHNVAGSSASYSVVIGNTCEDNEGAGILVQGGATLTTLVTVNGNTCTGNGIVSTSNGGIVASSGTTESIISGNIIDGNYVGIQAGEGWTVDSNHVTDSATIGIVAASPDATIKGNTVKDSTGYGIHISGSSAVNCLIANNRSYDSGVATQTAGIRVEAEGAIVTGNHCYGNTSFQIGFSGVTNYVNTDNILDDTASLSSSVTLSSGTSTVVNNTNITTHSTIIITPTNSTAGALAIWLSTPILGQITINHSTAAGTETVRMDIR